MTFPVTAVDGQTHTEGVSTFRYVAAGNAWVPSGSTVPTASSGTGVVLPVDGSTFTLFRLVGSTVPTRPDGLYWWNGSAWVAVAAATSTVTSFEFAQPTPAALWTIPHNLGRRPGGILLQDLLGADLEADDVSHPTTNVTLVSFLSPQAGSAILS